MNNEQESLIVNSVMNHDPYMPRPPRLFRSVNIGTSEMICEEMEETGQVIRLVHENRTGCIYFFKLNNQFYQVNTNAEVSQIVDVSLVVRM